MNVKPRYLITQSLLGAWQYMFDCYEDNSEEARESFLAYLRREPCEQTEAMLRGISFEDAVNGLLRGYTNPLEQHIKKYAKRGCMEREAACVRQVAEIVADGAYQVTAYRDVTIADEDFKLMAKCDWVKAGVIYDCKRVTNYEVGKYLDSPQHPMYMAVIPTAREFKYVVADGEDVHIETYRREDVVQPIENTVAQFVKYLKSEPGLWRIYADKWAAK